MTERIRVMVVEDSAEYRAVIELALRRDGKMELIGQFGTAEIALRHIQNADHSVLPDILLLDLQLPGMSGLESLPWFRKYMSRVPVMVLSQSDSEADVVAAIKSGATGYLLKSSTLQELKDAIRMVAKGGVTLDRGVAAYMMDRFKSVEPKNIGNTLSVRELEVLALIADGYAKKQICERLEISYNTVDTHVRRIYDKLEVQSAPAAVGKAYRDGLFPTGDQANPGS